MTEKPDRPWVLLRHGRSPARFLTRELGQRFYNQQRWNHRVDSDAALFGPKGEAWYCARWRTAEWVRDDDRRKRERQAEDETVEAPCGGDAA